MRNFQPLGRKLFRDAGLVREQAKNIRVWKDFEQRLDNALATAVQQEPVVENGNLHREGSSAAGAFTLDVNSGRLNCPLTDSFTGLFALVTGSDIEIAFYKYEK